VKQADGPARGGDEQDGDADPAPRPRLAADRRGRVPWIAAGAVVGQVAIVVLVSGQGRTLGAVLLAVGTLVVVGVVMMAGRRG
jgi:hypothetical protein